jgi:hypothetical protein
MSFALGDNSGGAADPRGVDDGMDRRNSAFRTMANAARLDGNDGNDGHGMPVITSRRDALTRIEELRRSWPSPSQYLRDPMFSVNGTYHLPFGGETWAGGGVNPPDSNGGTGGGGGVPRSAHNDGNGNWSIDSGDLGAMLLALTDADVTYSGTTSAPATSGSTSKGRGYNTSVEASHFAETASGKVDVR